MKAEGFATWQARVGASSELPEWIVLESASVCRGRVADQTHESPIAGAEVVATSQTGEPPVRVGTLTDDAGLFALELAAGDWTLEVAAPDFAARRFAVPDVDSDAAPWLFLLAHAGDCALGFRDSAGRPIGSVLVRLQPEGDDGREFAAQFSAETDGSGGLTLCGVPPGAYRMFATHNKYLDLAAAIAVTQAMESKIWTLEGASTLSGKLHAADGQPIAGGLLTLEGAGVHWQVGADPAGRYRFPRLEGAIYRLSHRPPSGGAPIEREVVVPADTDVTADLVASRGD